MDLLNNFNFFFNEYEGYLPLIFIFIFGAVIGSFLNVVIFRIPISINIEFINDLKRNNIKTNEEIEKYYKENQNRSLFSSSRCPRCNNKIKPWFNIPVLGYVLTRGKCSNCKEKISLEYPIIELINAIVYTTIFNYTEVLGVNEILLMTSFSLLMGLFIIDLKTHLLPDLLVYPFLVVGLYINFENGLNRIPDVAIIGALLYSLIFFYKEIRNIDFLIGFGDIKMFIACAAWIGTLSTVYTILIACIIGLLISLLLRKNAIAFGPSIILAFLIVYSYTTFI